MTEMNRFSRDSLLDTNQISKELYRSVLLHENFQCFGPNHDISNKGLMKQISVWILHICSFSGKSILNLKSTRSPEQTSNIKYYISIQQDWSIFRLEQLEQNFPCRNYINQNQYPASVEPLWKFTQLLYILCNCLHKRLW